jgi:hypothetical protein
MPFVIYPKIITPIQIVNMIYLMYNALEFFDFFLTTIDSIS